MGNKFVSVGMKRRFPGAMLLWDAPWGRRQGKIGSAEA